MLCEKFFLFGNFFRNGLFEVLEFIFVGFDFGFLEGADRFVLLEFFFVESDIDFKLVTFVEDFESLFFKFLKISLELVQFLFKVNVLLLIGLHFGGDFIDGMRRGSFFSDVNLLVEMDFEISIFFHLKGFFFVKAIVLLVLLIDVIPGDQLYFGEVIGLKVFEFLEFFVVGFEFLYFFVDLLCLELM